MKEYSIYQIKNKRILGRNIKDVENSKKPLALFWSGSCLEINVASKEVWALISCDYSFHEPWVCVLLNGCPISRFIPSKEKKQWVCLTRNLNHKKNNLISIMKETQPIPDDLKHSLFIHKIALSDDGKFESIPKRKLSIEFIGDSITTGEGLYGNCDEMDWITTFMSAHKTFQMQVAKTLNADFSVISQCGWGLCWDWTGNRNNTIPSIYNKVCGVLKGKYQEKLGTDLDYDYTQIKNDYVVINLMTNDNAAFSQNPWKDAQSGKEYKLITNKKGIPEKQTFDYIVQNVKDFLQQVRAHNSKAKIIWTYGMIKLDIVPVCLKKGIELYKKETCDKDVYLLLLDSMDKLEKNDSMKGSRGHPGPVTHKSAAEKIISFIKKI